MRRFVIGLLCVATFVGAKQPVSNPEEELLTLDNGRVRIGIDRARGASITHLSCSTNIACNHSA